MRKKTAKSTSFRENLDNFGIDLKHSQEMADHFEKEKMERFKLFAQTGVKFANFVKQVQDANKPQTHYMIAPSRPLTPRDLEEFLTTKKLKRSRKEPIILILERKTHTLFRKDRPEVRCSLARAPLRQKILYVIRLDFQKTANLAQDLDSTQESVRSTIDKINQKAMNDLSLKEKVILGEGIAGYRLNPLYSLVKK